MPIIIFIEFSQNLIYVSENLSFIYLQKLMVTIKHPCGVNGDHSKPTIKYIKLVLIFPILFFPLAR
jgi:hypothetical protein